ncbi:MAG: GNAT family N-acetyltransferase [Lachnospiraceae bacterium]|nr:GNAT family N-acetyltransferase [Lachnospiraceae bacterium]
MTDSLRVRAVQISDAGRLSEIYSYYVRNTAVSFEYEAPSADEFIRRIEHTTEKYPYLLCEKDDQVVGYAYAGAYSTREAYTWTVSTSIYVDKDHRREGIGSLLYASLEHELKKRGIINLLAGVAFIDKEDEYLSHDSCRFHLKEGYTEVAHMKSVGRKFDRWYDLLWFQKKI